MNKKISIIITILSISINLLAQSSDSLSNNVNTKYNKFRFGGYGELLFQNMDYGPDRYNNPKGSPKENRSYVDMPRFVFEFNYKLRKDIELVTEIEFEHGGTGSALELEYEEMGEYEMEMEKAGEVVLEQFFFKKSFYRALSIKIGHMILPIGITNSRHMPTQFFTTIRPEGESSILPLTWHETGIAVLGNYRRWSYEIQLVNGLDANGFSSAFWIRYGKQGIFETVKITNPAYTFSLQNKSIKNLTLQTGLYYGKSADNTAKPAKMDRIDGAVSIGSFNFEYNNKIIVRGNIIYGNLSNSDEITKINKSISKNIQYPRTPVAKNAMTYALELGYDILSFNKSNNKLYPFVRYEYYNSMENVTGYVFRDTRYARQIITAGFNYFLMDGLALKIDYSHRIIDKGNYNDENTLGVALVFNTWFLNK